MCPQIVRIQGDSKIVINTWTKEGEQTEILVFNIGRMGHYQIIKQSKLKVKQVKLCNVKSSVESSG